MATPTFNDFEIVKEPDLPRRFRLWPHQWVGIPAILIIPVLALFGVFGEVSDTQTVTTDDITLRIQYPSRTRYGFPQEITIELKNGSTKTLRDLALRMSQGYLENFSDVRVTPRAREAFKIPLGDLKPGESAPILIELRGAKYGFHEGIFTAGVSGAPVGKIKIRSFVFP